MDRLFRHIKPETVIDIGANVGKFSSRILREYPNCRVIMVEANPNCEPFLRVMDIPYEIIALSDKECVKEFYVEKSNKVATGASFYREKTEAYSEGNYDVLKIQCVTLDSLDYFKGKNIDLIKIDVQGSELDIILGGEKTIKRSNHVLLELSLLEYNSNSPHIQKVIDEMLRLGFCMLDIIECHAFAHFHDGLIFQIDALFKKIDIY